MCEPWLIMWSLSAGIYALCKWLTWSRSRVRNAPLWQQLAYLFAWPGMDADAFLGSTPHPPRLRGLRLELLIAFAKFLLGIVLIWYAVGQLPIDLPLLRGWVGMAGLIFLLHFGSFHVLSCLWRSVGIDAKPLMNCPILARSLSEFWALRWNTAFRDLTHRFLFKPLSKRFGPRVGLGLGFFASGLVHDLVISVPAGAGYGLPTLYFVIQGCGLLLERLKWARPLRGRVLTAVVILAPAYGLFHPPFVERVVLPFLKVIGVA
jgi:hypothetical protein